MSDDAAEMLSDSLDYNTQSINSLAYLFEKYLISKGIISKDDDVIRMIDEEK